MPCAQMPVLFAERVQVLEQALLAQHHCFATTAAQCWRNITAFLPLLVAQSATSIGLNELFCRHSGRAKH